MNILLTNDDGIDADGIKILCRALSEIADVYMFAPEGQRSASSQSITLKKPLYIEQIEYPYGKETYRTNGTPSDCVSLGLKLLESRGIHTDMVFSGINHGSNLGTDTLYSGTVAAATEGTLAGKPSVAVSVDSLHPKNWETACSLAVKAAVEASDLIPKGTVLNINTPDLPVDEIKGIRITRLGIRGYEDWLHELSDDDSFDVPVPKGNDKITYQIEMEGGDSAGEGDDEKYYNRVFNNVKYYIYGGTPKFYKDLDDDIDIAAHQDGYASITPLKFDMTDYELMSEIEGWDVF